MSDSSLCKIPTLAINIILVSARRCFDDLLYRTVDCLLKLLALSSACWTELLSLVVVGVCTGIVLTLQVMLLYPALAAGLVSATPL